MTFTSTHPISVDGVRLDTMAWNITKVERAVAARRERDIELPGRDGVVPSLDDDLEAGSLGLEMFVMGTDPDGGVPPEGRRDRMWANLDELVHLFGKRHSLLDITNGPPAVTNLATNPSMETAGAAVEVARNLATNPSMETAGAAVEVARNLVANPSFETDGVGWTFNTSGGTYTFSRPTTGADSGTTHARWETTVASTGANVGPYTFATAAPGDVVTVRARVRSNAALTMRANAEWQSGLGATNGAAVTLAPGAWTTLTVTGTAPAGTTSVAATFYTTGTVAVGNQIDIDSVLVVKGPTAPDYFDGSTPAAGDYTYAWTGTAHASASVKNGVEVAGYFRGGGGVTRRTGEWAASGSKALRLSALGHSNNDTFAYVAGDAGTIHPGLVGGKTYTASATFNTPVALTGTLSERARAICVHTKTASGNYVITNSPAAPVTGVGRVSVTFTVPEGATDAFIRLYNGSGVAGESVFVDDFSLTETPAEVPYFDGSTAPDAGITYAWTGTAHASASVKNGVEVTGYAGGFAGATPIRSTTAQVGTYSLAIMANSTSEANSTYRALSDFMPVTAGQKYTGSAFVRMGAAARSATVLFAWYDAAQNGIGGTDTSTSVPTDTGWSRVSVTGTAPTGATQVRLQFVAERGTGGVIPQGEVTYFDSAMVTETPEEVPYFDGDTSAPGGDRHVWTGTPHASTSVKHDGRTRRAWAKVRDTIAPDVSVTGASGEFTVGLVLPYGVWEDPVALTWTQVAPVTAAPVVTLQGATERIGDAIFAVKGPATTPRITDTATGSWIQLNAALASGDTWRVNALTWATRTGTTLTVNSPDTDGTDRTAVTITGGPQRGSALTLVPVRDTGARRVGVTLSAGSGIVNGTTSLAVKAARKFAL